MYTCIMFVFVFMVILFIVIFYSSRPRCSTGVGRAVGRAESLLGLAYHPGHGIVLPAHRAPNRHLRC